MSVGFKKDISELLLDDNQRGEDADEIDFSHMSKTSKKQVRFKDDT